MIPHATVYFLIEGTEPLKRANGRVPRFIQPHLHVYIRGSGLLITRSAMISDPPVLDRFKRTSSRPPEVRKYGRRSCCSGKDEPE